MAQVNYKNILSGRRGVLFEIYHISFITYFDKKKWDFWLKRENDIKVKVFDTSPRQPSLKRRWGGLLPIGEIEEPDIHERSSTKSREWSSVILTLLLSLLLSLPFPFCLFPLPQAKHYCSPLLPVCLWLKQNFSIAMAHLGLR